MLSAYSNLLRSTDIFKQKMLADNCNRYGILSIKNEFFKNSDSFSDKHHEIDIYRIYTDDWQIERFILTSTNHQSAYKHLIEAITWKMKFGIHDRRDNYFKDESEELVNLELFGQDKTRRYIFWHNMSSNMENNIDKIDILKLIHAHLQEKNDQIVHRKGENIITWLKSDEKFNMRHIKLDIIKFNMQLRQYYPLMVRSNLFVDMPKRFVIFAKSILYLHHKSVKGIKEEFNFITLNQLYDLIDEKLINMKMNREK